MSPPHVVVVGGGLAGLGAALDCADAGARVTVVERRRHLGGLTWSFERDGRWIDNGQHVFLRCCRAYLGFLDRIGSTDDVEIQPRLDITVLRPDPRGGPTRAARLRRNNLPAPFHLGAALLGYRHLRVADRLRIGLAALPLRRLDLTSPALDDESFGDWLGRHGQSPAAINGLWDLITVATVNLPAAEASLAMGAKVFQTGLLRDAPAADLGWSKIPLGALHGERAHAALRQAGVEVVTDTRVECVRRLPAGLAVCAAGRSFDADAVVLALPHTEVGSVAPPDALCGPAGLAQLGTSAIVDVHLVFDRPVTALPMLAALDSPAQWVFDRTASSGLRQGPDDRRQYLAVSLSAANDRMGTHPHALADTVTEEIRRLLPVARSATVVDSLVTKERTATFRAGPGSEALRPGPATRTPGLYLAGAWSDTGWPATMEGALRSGRRAARAALSGAGLTRALPEEAP